MLQNVKSFIAKYQLMDKLDQIGLAISGGKDSVCMAHLLEQMKVPFVMVHVNFNLRGVESNSDAQFVRELAANLIYSRGVLVKEVDTQAYALLHKTNTQLAARELRYAYFDQLRKDGIITKLITAHHQSDLVETFFINLNRKSGISGLKSIPIQRDYIIRPLLTVSSKEIKDYLQQNTIHYREDSSNTSTKYARNRWRNILLPSLAGHLPHFEKNAASSIHKLQQENEVLTWLIQEKLNAIKTLKNDTLYIDQETLITYPQPTVFLYRILDKYGFNYPQCEQILANSYSTGALFCSSTYELLIDRNTFIVQKRETKYCSPVKVHSTGIFALGKHTIAIEAASEMIFSENTSEETVSISPELFPLTLRQWQEGDKLQPLGMKGSKLLSDFFIDQKINVLDKQTIPLLCKDNEVLWICGVRVSEKMRVEDKNHLYKLRIV